MPNTIRLQENIAKEIQQRLDAELLTFFAKLKTRMLSAGSKFFQGDSMVYIHGSTVKAAYLKQKYNFNLTTKDIDFILICPEIILKEMPELSHPYSNSPIYLFTNKNTGKVYELVSIFQENYSVEKMLGESANSRDFKENALFIALQDGIVERVIYDFVGGIKNLNDWKIETVASVSIAFGQMENNRNKKNYKTIRILRLFHIMAQAGKLYRLPKLPTELEAELYYLSGEIKDYIDQGLLRNQLYKSLLSGNGLKILELYEKYNYAAQIFPLYDFIKNDIKKIVGLFENKSVQIELKKFYAFLLWPYLVYKRSTFGSRIDHLCDVINTLFVYKKIYFYPEEYIYLILKWDKWLDLFLVDKNFLKTKLEKHVATGIEENKKTTYVDILKRVLTRTNTTTLKKIFPKDIPKKPNISWPMHHNTNDNNVDTKFAHEAKNFKGSKELKSDALKDFFSVNRYNVIASCDDYGKIEEECEEDSFLTDRSFSDNHSKKKNRHINKKFSSKDEVETQDLKELVETLVNKKKSQQETNMHDNQRKIGKYIAQIIKQQSERQKVKLIQNITADIESTRKKIASIEAVEEYSLFKGLFNMAFQDIGKKSYYTTKVLRFNYIVFAAIISFSFVYFGLTKKFSILAGQLVALFYIDMVCLDMRYSAFLAYGHNIKMKQSFIYKQLLAFEKGAKEGSIRNLNKEKAVLLKKWEADFVGLQKIRLGNKGRAWFETKQQLRMQGFKSFFRPYYSIEVAILMMTIEGCGAFLAAVFGNQKEPNVVLSYPELCLLFVVHYLISSLIDNKWASEVNNLEEEANKDMELILTSTSPSVSNSF